MLDIFSIFGDLVSLFFWWILPDGWASKKIYPHNWPKEMTTAIDGYLHYINASDYENPLRAGTYNVYTKTSPRDRRKSKIYFENQRGIVYKGVLVHGENLKGEHAMVLENVKFYREKTSKRIEGIKEKANIHLEYVVR